nr:reverse transcriptase domain-containing protein [Tanacetum cinerariifolium]
MMTVRKRLGPLPTHRLAVRHSVDYSSSDLFTFDDSSRYSPLDLSSETSSNSSSDALSDSSSSHSSLDNSSPVLPSGTRPCHQLCLLLPSIPHSPAAITERPSYSSLVGPSRNRSRSPTTSIPIYSPDCSDKSSESFVPRETSLRDDVVIRYSDEPYSEPDIDPEIQLEIDKCIEYTDALRAKGIDARVVVETVAREEAETSMKGPVKVRVERVTHPAVPADVLEPAQEEGVIEGTYEMIVVMSQQSVVLSERISELEQDNTRLRDMMDVARDGNKGVNRNRGVNGNGGLTENGGLNRNGGLNDNGNEGGNDNGYGNENGGGNGYRSGSFMHVAREVMLEVLKTRDGLTITQETTVGSNQLLSDKMLEARMWQELTRHEAMRERGDYAIRGGGANPDSNIVMGTFLLNNYYASMLFDSGADRSFVSSTFSALLDIVPSTLDTSYVVELADERIS